MKRLFSVLGALVLLAALAYVFFVYRGEEPEPSEPIPAAPTEPALLPEPPPPAVKPPPPAPRPGPPQQLAQPEEFPRRAGPLARPEPDVKLPPPPPAPRPETVRQKFTRTRTHIPNVVLRGEPIPDDQLDEIMVWGTDKVSLRGSIQDQYDEFVRCYDAWLDVQPDLEGKLKLHFTIGMADPNDSLASVTALDVLESELDHAVFEGCILGALQDLAYEPTDGDINVRYPLIFRAADDE